MTTSPLLGLPGAVAGDGIDAGVAAHYGSLYGEQRALEAGEGFVDLSHRDVVRIAGPDRLTWLHSLTTQFFEGLEPGRWVNALVLSPNGHVEHAFAGVDDGEAFTLHTEPGRAEALIAHLERMKFLTRVDIADVTDEIAVAARFSSLVEERPRNEGASRDHRMRFDLVPREQLTTYAEAAGPAAGLWAYEALRIARGEPRLGIDTDERTIPNEIGLLDGQHDWAAVHLDKGCYRGQETVARVHNLGRPPRRLTLLHLDGSENRLPAPGSEIFGDRGGREAGSGGRGGREAGSGGRGGREAGSGGRGASEASVTRPIGVVGSSARHHELGPIALALVKRNIPVDAQLEVDGLPAAQEVVVDPEVGLHFRPPR